MAFVYIVRCNFNEPAQEQAWNTWYSGPKIAQMLRKPHFRTCQRFKRDAGRGRDYLALWTLQSPEPSRPSNTPPTGASSNGRRTSPIGAATCSMAATRPKRLSRCRRRRLALVSFDGMSRGRGERRPRGDRAIATGHDVAAGHRPRPPHPDDGPSGAARCRRRDAFTAGNPRVQQALYRPISRFRENR